MGVATCIPLSLKDLSHVKPRQDITRKNSVATSLLHSFFPSPGPAPGIFCTKGNPGTRPGREGNMKGRREFCALAYST